MRSVLLVAITLVAAAGSPAQAQLRPLDPIDWDRIELQGYSVSVGVAQYWSQRASLAGTSGRLIELGTFRATWATGQIGVEASGTALRVFRDGSAFAPPYGEDVRGVGGGSRIDAGDHRLTTILLFTPGPSRVDAALRFGVRLPTTDDTQGLERDQTDFFSTVGARVRGEAWSVAGELGIGVFGTRSPVNEQVDPILFAAAARYDLGWSSAELAVVGQHDPRRNPDQRGNEDLGEARLGVRIGGDPWLRFGLARGWETFSPGFGVFLEVGWERQLRERVERR